MDYEVITESENQHLKFVEHLSNTLTLYSRRLDNGQRCKNTGH
jgi:hypothetical protein